MGDDEWMMGRWGGVRRGGIDGRIRVDGLTDGVNGLDRIGGCNSRCCC